MQDREAISLDRTADAEELAKFEAMAADWWNPNGKFRPLHKFNPLRLKFLRDRIAARFGRDIAADRPFEGLTLLDIGCGGGLLCEPMARLGATVTGIDATERNIGVARRHAASMRLDIDYRFAAAADLVAENRQFDVVLNMEVIEHVADRAAFLADSAALLRPGGLMFLATLNRTPKSYLLAILGAEYVLRWLPRGTHDWRRFVKPSELAAGLRASGLTLSELTGLAYDPMHDRWSLAPDDLGVNYIALAEKPA